MSNNYRKVLTIAGSDSGGGAGIQADLKTVSALGCYGLSVITALTAQNTTSVTGIHAVPASFAEEQMEAVFSDIGADAVKIGMLYSVELIESVARQLKKHRIRKIVLDPVMIAKSGDKLLQDDAIEALKKHIIPLATIVTPNLPEASVLAGFKVYGSQDMLDAAFAIARIGGRSVVIKGGHAEDGNCVDLLYLIDEDYSIVLDGERIETLNSHGTGCTFSSAIASFLARGYSIEDSVRSAKNYISEAIKAGSRYKLGHGHGPVHHFFKFWE